MTIKKPAIGVDIGGTAIKCALVSPEGSVVSVSRRPTEGDKGRDRILANISDSVHAKLKEHGLALTAIAGIGMGTPGFVVDGVILGNPNMPAWTGTPILAEMRKRFDVPFFASNDANLAALAECHFGAGIGAKHLVFYILGTGVGGGIVVNGQVYEGVSGMAGELGHMVVHQGGRRCGCGSLGCVEAYAGSLGITGMAREMLDTPEGRESAVFRAVGGDLSKLTPKVIYDCAKAGDPVANAVNDVMCSHLAVAVGATISALNPQMVVLGGGVMEAGDIIMNKLKEKLHGNAYHTNLARCRIEYAKLGENAGVIGCGALVFSKLGMI
ncbi:MAG: ROK family protein [Fibrobacterota bacterium]